MSKPSNIAEAERIVSEEFAHLPPGDRKAKVHAIKIGLDIADAERKAARPPRSAAQTENSKRQAFGPGRKPPLVDGVRLSERSQRHGSDVPTLGGLIKHRLGRGETASGLVDTLFDVAGDREHPLVCKALDMILDRTEGKVPQPVTADVTIEVARISVIGATEEEMAAIKEFEGGMPIMLPPADEDDSGPRSGGETP